MLTVGHPHASELNRRLKGAPSCPSHNWTAVVTRSTRKGLHTC